MNAHADIRLDQTRLDAALTRFPRDRAMWIDGRDVGRARETIERRSPAHGALVTRMPRGAKADAEAAIAAAGAGAVSVNTVNDGTPEPPFGGYRLSGLGRELGRYAVKDYTEEKTFHLHNGARTNWWLPRA